MAQQVELLTPFLRLMARQLMGPKVSRVEQASGFVNGVWAELARRFGADLERIPDDGSLRRFAVATLRNDIQDAARREGAVCRGGGRVASLDELMDEAGSRLRELAGSVTLPGDAAIRAEEILLLARELERLPRSQQLAIEFRHLEGLPLKDIASIMELSEESVGGLLRRGMASLRKSMARRADS